LVEIEVRAHGWQVDALVKGLVTIDDVLVITAEVEGLLRFMTLATVGVEEVGISLAEDGRCDHLIPAMRPASCGRGRDARAQRV
jgi:hypothetical protein